MDDNLYQIVKENNKILRGMRRESRFKTFMGIIRWIIIAIVAVALYVIAQPFLEQFQTLSQQVQEQTSTINTLKEQAGDSLATLNNLLPLDGAKEAVSNIDISGTTEKAKETASNFDFGVVTDFLGISGEDNQ